MKKSFYSLSKFSFFLLLCSLFCFSLLSCGKKEINYFSYVSENRNNVFLCQTETLSVKINSSLKESPYLADGIKRELSPRTEIYLTAESGEKDYEIYLNVNGRHGGDMSYDNVKGEYFYFLTLDTSALQEIELTLIEEGTEQTLVAKSVLEEGLLLPKEILEKVRLAETELFQTLTKDNRFQGEIHLRLIHENGLYYFVGIIDKSGKTIAFLCDGKTGKILAKRG